MLMFVCRLEQILSKESIESIKKDVTYHILNNPDILKSPFRDDYELTKDHLKPERIHFTVQLEVMPKEIKKKKIKLSREEKSRQVFKQLVGVVHLNEQLLLCRNSA